MPARDGVGRPTLIAFVLAAVVVSFPANAWGASRSGQADDPRDQPTNPSGGPNRPDIAQVRFAYDDFGTLSVTGRFYDPLAQSDLEGFVLGLDMYGPDQAGACLSRVVSGYVRLADAPSVTPRTTRSTGRPGRPPNPRVAH